MFDILDSLNQWVAKNPVQVLVISKLMEKLIETYLQKVVDILIER